MQTINKAVLINDQIANPTIVPANQLDNLLKLKSVENFEISLRSRIDGEKITPDNRNNFYKKFVDNAVNKKYTTTDHLITSVKVDNIDFIYVSLDNSVRSNINECPLYARLKSIRNIVNNITKSMDNYVLYFSESCRPSFMGGMDKKENLTSWLKIRKNICQEFNVNYITERRNNDDQSDMSFGVSAFYSNPASDLIETYFIRNILSEGFGSVAVGTKIKTSKIVWGVHFPLDFKGVSMDNMGFKTMMNLQQLITEFKGSVCAFGDFNMIPGNINNAINQAISPEFEFVFPNEPTFFNSFFDTIPIDKD